TGFGWRWIFVLSLPFAIAGIALARRTLANVIVAERHPFDLAGFVLMAAGLVAALNVPVIGHARLDVAAARNRHDRCAGAMGRLRGARVAHARAAPVVAPVSP